MSDDEIVCLGSPSPIKKRLSSTKSKPLQAEPPKPKIKPQKAVLISSSSEDEDLLDIDEGRDNFNLPLSSISSNIRLPVKDMNHRPLSKERNFQSSQSSSSSSALMSQASLSKAQQKEAAAEKKRIEKEAKRLENEKKKAEAEREKELKKVESELRKNSKPGESVKFMTIVLDETIANKLDSLVPLIVASEINYKMISNPPVENSITFQRELFHQAMNDQLQLQKVSRVIDEDQLMILLDSDQAIPMVNAQLKMGSTAGEDFDIDLVTWVESIKACNTKKKITVLVYDIEKYFRKLKRSTQQEFRNRVLNADDDNNPQRKKRKNKNDLPQISKTELQSALIELQLRTGVNYRMIKDQKELAMHLVQYTKAIADAPFKQQRSESQGFDWYAMFDSAGSVKIDKDGNGLRKLWIDQLQQFNNVGADIATAISNKYPSPKSLIEAYKECDNVEESLNMLKNLTATSGVGPLARTRKVGPELSKKMYRFFTSTNGDRFLGSTSDMR